MISDRVRIRRRTTIAALTLISTLLGASACGGTDRTSTTAPPAGAGSAAPTGTVTVLAASSLTEAFGQIGKDFEAAHPGTTVTFSFDGSAGLATQITSGAPADVFASASPATMKAVTDAGDANGTPTVFVRNQLVIGVRKGNPKAIKTLADLAKPDLAKPGLKVALCAEQVPCGAAAKKILTATGTALKPVTLEQNVKSALAKVKLGEVDAALVYRTDAKASATDVEGIEFAESAQAINDYPIVVLKAAPNPAGAQAFVDFVRTDKAAAVLADAGFQQP